MEINERIQKADAGDWNEQYLVGRAYQEGTLLPQNYTLAAKYYEKAADQGHIDSTLALAYLKSLTIKLKVTFNIKGYKNGRLVTDNKTFIVDLMDQPVIPSYNADELFVVEKFFLTRVYIKRTQKGVESKLLVEKGKKVVIEENQNSFSYKYTFEIVFSTSALVERDPREDIIMLRVDHEELEKDIFYACLQKDSKINPYRHDIGAIYWPMKQQILREKFDEEWLSPIDVVKGKYDVTTIEGACEIDQELWWSLLFKN